MDSNVDHPCWWWRWCSAVQFEMYMFKVIKRRRVVFVCERRKCSLEKISSFSLSPTLSLFLFSLTCISLLTWFSSVCVSIYMYLKEWGGVMVADNKASAELLNKGISGSLNNSCMLQLLTMMIRVLAFAAGIYIERWPTRTEQTRCHHHLLYSLFFFLSNFFVLFKYLFLCRLYQP